MARADDLHRAVFDHNWDLGAAIPVRALDDRECDRGTALLVFWCLSPSFYLAFSSEEDVPVHAREGWRVLQRLLRDYPKGWPTARIRFDPRNNPKGDLTADSLPEVVRWRIPEVFYEASGGGGEPPAMMLRRAVDDRNPGACKAAVALGADPSTEILRAATTDGDVLAALLEVGGDPDTKHREYGSALIQAVRGGHLDGVRALLAAGAKVDARHKGNTALGEAVGRGRLDMVEVLEAAGARPANASLYGAVFGGVPAIRYVLDAGVDVDQRGPDGETALFRAADLGLVEVVGALLDAGADATIGRKKDGKRPRDKAAEGASSAREPDRLAAYEAILVMLPP